MTPVSPGQCEVCHYPAAECDAAGSRCAGRTMRELRARAERAESHVEELQAEALDIREGAPPEGTTTGQAIIAIRAAYTRAERAEADRDEAQGVAAAYRDAQIRTVAERNAAIERLATAEAELARQVAARVAVDAAENKEIARLRFVLAALDVTSGEETERAERAEARLATYTGSRSIDATILDAATDAAFRLRTALRAAAIRIEPFDRGRGEQTWIGCHACQCAWPEGEIEDHGDGCLAAPSERPDE